jgi:hypothetical protein
MYLDLCVFSLCVYKYTRRWSDRGRGKRKGKQDSETQISRGGPRERYEREEAKISLLSILRVCTRTHTHRHTHTDRQTHLQARIKPVEHGQPLLLLLCNRRLGGLQKGMECHRHFLVAQHPQHSRHLRFEGGGSLRKNTNRVGLDIRRNQTLSCTRPQHEEEGIDARLFRKAYAKDTNKERESERESERGSERPTEREEKAERGRHKHTQMPHVAPQPAPFPSVAARSRRGRPGTRASARPLLVLTPARQRSRRLTRGGREREREGGREGEGESV